MNINWLLVLKIVTGIVVVPIAIIANSVWPWWGKASLPLKIITGPIVLPIAGLAFVLGAWWNSL